METILVDRSDGVVTVCLNRPEKKNAADDTMWSELRTVLEEVAGRPQDRVVVLTGAGGAFCSGADLGSVDPDEHPLARMRRIGAVALALHRVPQPTLAKVGGVAAGAGANLALGCDLVVASEEATFSEIFARRGLSIDFGGSWLLPRLVGLHRAKELAFLADMLSAREAAEVGLVNRVVAPGDLDGVAGEWATRLAEGPPLALSLSKTLLDHGLETSLDQALEDEARAQSVNLASDDAAEALQAFRERRTPRFRGS
ncbi:MAG TPA: enoyl-CoA hydratase-related protein [Acidimicrobiales bacterium]|nr:enoyl-CoA hydratase-related protein [Acidimicrobiales bacterium]